MLSYPLLWESNAVVAVKKATAAAESGAQRGRASSRLQAQQKEVCPCLTSSPARPVQRIGGNPWV
jgi:hypothetical protein